MIWRAIKALWWVLTHPRYKRMKMSGDMYFLGRDDVYVLHASGKKTRLSDGRDVI